jgi:hypothetical protein
VLVIGIVAMLFSTLYLLPSLYKARDLHYRSPDG